MKLRNIPFLAYPDVCRRHAERYREIFEHVVDRVQSSLGLRPQARLAPQYNSGRALCSDTPLSSVLWR